MDQGGGGLSAVRRVRRAPGDAGSESAPLGGADGRAGRLSVSGQSALRPGASRRRCVRPGGSAAARRLSRHHVVRRRTRRRHEAGLHQHGHRPVCGRDAAAAALRGDVARAALAAAGHRAGRHDHVLRGCRHRVAGTRDHR